MSPALAGGFLSSVPPGKSWETFSCRNNGMCVLSGLDSVVSPFDAYVCTMPENTV